MPSSDVTSILPMSTASPGGVRPRLSETLHWPASLQNGAQLRQSALVRHSPGLRGGGVKWICIHLSAITWVIGAWTGYKSVVVFIRINAMDILRCRSVHGYAAILSFNTFITSDSQNDQSWIIRRLLLRTHPELSKNQQTSIFVFCRKRNIDWRKSMFGTRSSFLRLCRY